MLSRMEFDGVDARLEQHATVAGLGYRFGENTTLQWSVGAVVGGDLRSQGVEHEVLPGFVTSLSVSYQWLRETDWFLVTSFTGGVSTTVTRAETDGAEGRLTAVDFRGSVLAGYTFGGVVSPYLLVRGFGGPVFWEEFGVDRTGSDRDHYAVGAGITARAGDWLFSVSGSAAGERSVSGGVSFLF